MRQVLLLKRWTVSNWASYCNDNGIVQQGIHIPLYACSNSGSDGRFDIIGLLVGAGRKNEVGGLGD